MYNGEDILTYDKKKMWEMRRKLQIIFQDPYSSLNPRMTVYDLISAPLEVYKVGTKEEAYAYLDNAFKTDAANFTSAKALYTYFELFVDDYEAGKKGLELQQVFDKYDEITEKLDWL